MPNLFAKAVAEFSGTLVLVMTVVGSGIMGTQMSFDLGTALLINTFATVLVLVLLIQVLAPLSGAHLNPAVSMIAWLRNELRALPLVVYVFAQILGAMCGVALANFMFGLPALHFSGTERSNPGLLLGEVIATAGLVIVILVFSFRKQSRYIPFAVAGWIGSAYFFTSSTSFANPAVTIGRMFSDTFSGIAASSVALFIAAQLAGALLGWLIARVINSHTKEIHV